MRGSVDLRHPDRAVPGLGEHRLRRLRQESHARVDESASVRGQIDHAIFSLHPKRIPTVEPNPGGLGPREPPLATEFLPSFTDEPGEPVRCPGD